MRSPTSRLWTCSQCLRAQSLRGTSLDAGPLPIDGHRRAFHATPLLQETPSVASKPDNTENAPPNGEAQGAMSRRLAEMAEETIDTGSKSDRKLMQDAGFSDELKKQLEERIAQTGFTAQNQQAASEVNMPV